ncbi:DUF6766 family protein [Agromyces sp. ZXT2-3]|uniref:DUF6766 family protein n=1 Tax=Agromyces sp. ZXT2-3 TaxID=3461152 RepID=UPI004054E7D7
MTRYRLHGAAREGTFWQRHALSIVLLLILSAQTVAAIFAGHHVWVGEQEAHGAPLEAGEFWIWWFWEYNISLVADTFGVILIVLLSKRLEEVGSAESKHEETEETEEDAPAARDAPGPMPSIGARARRGIK